MDIVTIFQCGGDDRFTTDTSRTCSEEIRNPDHLCFAYYLPNVFYFAEGGWGHHMPELPNHPLLEAPETLKLKLSDFKTDNTVVINGNYTFRDVIGYLKKTGYIEPDRQAVKILAVGKEGQNTCPLAFDDPMTALKLADFNEEIDRYAEQHFAGCPGFIYYLVFDLT